MSGNPSHWVERFLPLITAGGTVLDLASGPGRHAVLLARRGFRVEAVDRDAEALAGIAAVAPGIVTRLAGLEGGAWPYCGRAFDGIVVTNYLHRPLLSLLVDALAENGVLIYETFMLGNERFGKPSSPAFLLRPGELLELAGSGLTVVAFEQGAVALPRPAMVQRICAVRGVAAQLPA